MSKQEAIIFSVMDLRYHKGWTYTEIARSLGITKNAVAGIIYREKYRGV